MREVSHGKKCPAKRLVGYARGSTQQQELPRQTKALERVGCDVICSDMIDA
jgi:hypothetical protein